MSDVLFWVSYGLLWLLVVVVALLLFTFYRVLVSYREQLAASSPGQSSDLGLLQGQLAPKFESHSTKGETINNAYMTGESNALLFISPLCPSCAATTMEMEAVSHKVAGHLIVICEGSSADCELLEGELQGAFPFVIDESREIGRQFGIMKTPTAVIIDVDGRIDRYGSPMRKEELEELAPELFDSGVRPTILEPSAR